MAYSRSELHRVRGLAREVAAIAREPRMLAIKKRWADVNALRKPDRAPVWCRPVGCWAEILTEEMLECQDPLLRHLEHSFLQIMHKRSIGDDEPVEDCLEMGAVLKVDPPDVWGVPIGRRSPVTQGGAWAYDPPLKDIRDIAKLRMPAFTYCEEETAARKCQLEEILGGTLPVRVRAEPPLGATLGTAAADFRGLEQMMLDMAIEPDFMHRLMAHLRDATLAAMDAVEAAGIFTPNNTGPMTCSDPVGSPPPDGKPTCANLWCMANAQEFDQVSPAMWEEFCLAYQVPIFERFGLVGYGCCENLTHKLDGVLSIPNLRILTSSAWTDLDSVIGRAGEHCCIMWRQKASDVVFPDDPGKIREDLMNGARRLQGCRYQIVLRELQTLAGHSDRLHEWTRFAIDAAETYA
jgi:hypothetical protein